jgi:hypothetical protein
MASSPKDKGDKPRGKDRMPSGVRGPGGPPPAGASSSGQRGPLGAPSPGRSDRRRAFEERSYPYLRRLSALPRWLVVITPAVLLFVGLILTGPVAWLGGILLLLVTALLAWLTALSWPAITPGSRLLRSIVVLALFGVAVLKLMGRF